MVSSTEYESNISSASLPGEKLTVFAVRLAVLEKTASGVGVFGCVWGTVVILGAFAGNIDKTNLCFITLILVIKTSWKLSTTHLQCDDTLSNSILQAACMPFSASDMETSLLWIQLASATSCVILSLIKLAQHPNYEDNGDKNNIKVSLITFYALALAESLLFLLQKGYWEWKVTHGRLFEAVNRDCEFEGSASASVTRYFYYVYSKCKNGSICDGSKLNMVSFGMDLILCSDSAHEHVIGAQILRNFATISHFSQRTLHMISINQAAMERLVDMVSCKDAHIRRAASEILLILACKNQHSFRIAGISGSLKSIATLLPPHDDGGSNGLDQMGLDILKELARNDHDVCREIGNTRGLLRKILDLIHAEESLPSRAIPIPVEIVRVERALEVLKILASMPGAAGKQLREQISEIVHTVSYLRDIIKREEKQRQLQILGI